MNRFKSRPQFQAALNAPVIARSPHFVMHRMLFAAQTIDSQENTRREERLPTAPAQVFSNEVWLGAMVPKRWAKRAVTRNALKRQIYTLSASPDYRFSCGAYLIRLRAEFSRQLFPSASSESLQAAARTELAGLFQIGLKAP